MHTHAVDSDIQLLGNNIVLKERPPSISDEEQRLNRRQLCTLSQLRSGHRHLLQDYKHRMFGDPSDIRTDCGALPQDARHLFACKAHPRASHQGIYGGIQCDQVVRLATSTTGTLTDLTADLVVANNNNQRFHTSSSYGIALRNARLGRSFTTCYSWGQFYMSGGHAVLTYPVRDAVLQHAWPGCSFFTCYGRDAVLPHALINNYY